MSVIVDCFTSVLSDPPSKLTFSFFDTRPFCNTTTRKLSTARSSWSTQVRKRSRMQMLWRIWSLFAAVAVSGTITHPTGLSQDKPVRVQKPGEGGVFGYMPPELNREEDLSAKLPRHMHCDGAAHDDHTSLAHGASRPPNS